MRKQNIVNRRSVLEAAGDYRTKATLGITGWFRLRVHIDGGVRPLNSWYYRNIKLQIGVPMGVIPYKKIWLITVDSIHKPYIRDGILSCMDNTAGSLTQLQKSLIIGSMLGDGYIRRVNGRRDAFLEMNHSLTQKDYVDWKYSILKNLTRSGPKSRKGNGTRIAYRFFTKQHPEFTKMMVLFYRGKKKCIPDLILDPISLAVWYMDDGSRCSEDNVYLNTQQFSTD